MVRRNSILEGILHKWVYLFYLLFLVIILLVPAYLEGYFDFSAFVFSYYIIKILNITVIFPILILLIYFLITIGIIKQDVYTDKSIIFSFPLLLIGFLLTYYGLGKEGAGLMLMFFGAFLIILACFFIIFFLSTSLFKNKNYEIIIFFIILLIISQGIYFGLGKTITQETKDANYFKYSMKNKSTNNCFLIQDNAMRDNCYYNRIKKFGSDRFQGDSCGNIQKSSLRLECIELYESA